MMNDDEDMVYVAADPEQPGTAWAISVDHPDYKKDLAKSISKWIKQGAIVMRVKRSVGVKMLDKWVKK